MKAIKAHLLATDPERVPIFEKSAAGFAKKSVLRTIIASVHY